MHALQWLLLLSGSIEFRSLPDHRRNIARSNNNNNTIISIVNSDDNSDAIPISNTRRSTWDEADRRAPIETMIPVAAGPEPDLSSWAGFGRGTRKCASIRTRESNRHRRRSRWQRRRWRLAIVVIGYRDRCAGVCHVRCCCCCCCWPDYSYWCLLGTSNTRTNKAMSCPHPLSRVCCVGRQQRK